MYGENYEKTIVLFYSILFYSILFYALTMLASCWLRGDDDDDDYYIAPPAPQLALTDISLDYTKLVLSAKTTLANGTLIRATCSSNNHTEEAQVDEGSITWNFAQAFPSNIRAGKQYTITFTADGYTPKEESIWYFAKIKYTINCADEIQLFVNSIDDFKLPTIKLINYDASDVEISSSLRSGGANLDLEQFKNYIKDSLANPPESDSEFYNGIGATWKYSITPKNIENDDLRNSFSIGVPEEKIININFKYQILVGSVGISRTDEYLNAICFADDIAPDDDIDTAGGKISYQWQISTTGADNEWTDIAGATSKSYQLTSDAFEKYFRVKIVQSWQKDDGTYENLEAKYSAPTAKIMNYVNTTMSTVFYNGIVMMGDKPDPSKLSGEIIDVYGNRFQPNDFVIKSKYTVVLNSSQNWVFTLSRSGYEDADIKVFITVQHKIEESDIPGFYDAVGEISAGCIQFSDYNCDLEYSKFYKGNWKQIDFEEIPASEGITIYFRFAAIGTPNEIGYIKESESLSRVVTSEYIGKKTSGTGIIESIENTKLELSKETLAGGTIIITPNIKNEPLFKGLYTFDYMIDDTPYSDPSFKGTGIQMDSSNRLVIPSGVLKSDVYQIFCLATVKINGATLKTLSAVYSLKIN